MAIDADLDLVEIAPEADPPVCKIMDLGKFKYEIAQKARSARKNQTHVLIKEMKMRPKIDTHDYLKTIILAFVGAIVSFVVTLVLKKVMKRFEK